MSSTPLSDMTTFDRVCILPYGVEVTHIDHFGLGFNHEYEPDATVKVFDDANSLPKDMQDKLAVLMVCDAKTPSADIPGVGRRISKDIFWLYDCATWVGVRETRRKEHTK
jgi:hypothetical protein